MKTIPKDDAALDAVFQAISGERSRWRRTLLMQACPILLLLTIAKPSLLATKGMWNAMWMQ
jgi:hypothetical protein